MPPSWSQSLATATRLRWSTVCWTKLPRRVQTISHLLEDPLLCRLLQSPFMQEWKNQFKFRYFARNTVFCRCRVQTISHLLEDALLLPTASITIYAGTKESILSSVFRAQNSSSSLTNTISANQPFWYDLLRPNAVLPPNRALRVHGLRLNLIWLICDYWT